MLRNKFCCKVGMKGISYKTLVHSMISFIMKSDARVVLLNSTYVLRSYIVNYNGY